MSGIKRPAACITDPYITFTYSLQQNTQIKSFVIDSQVYTILQTQRVITDYLAVSRIVKGSVSRINAIRTRSIITQILVLDVAGTRTYSIHCHHPFFQFPGICIFKVIGCIVTIRYIPPDRTDFISFIIIIRAITFQDNLGFIMVFGNDCFRVIRLKPTL